MQLLTSQRLGRRMPQGEDYKKLLSYSHVLLFKILTKDMFREKEGERDTQRERETIHIVIGDGTCNLSICLDLE